MIILIVKIGDRGWIRTNDRNPVAGCKDLTHIILYGTMVLDVGNAPTTTQLSAEALTFRTI